MSRDISDFKRILLMKELFFSMSTFLAFSVAHDYRLTVGTPPWGCNRKRSKEESNLDGTPDQTRFQINQ